MNKPPKRYSKFQQPVKLTRKKIDRVSLSGVRKIGDTAHVIVRALENPKYKWRTVEGVAKEVGTDPAIVRRVIDRLGERVVKASVASTTGDELFTTREHLRESESFISRLGAVLRNRGA